MAFTKLEKLLNQSIYKAGLTYQIKNAKVFDCFVKVISRQIGKEAAKRVKPLYIKNKVLVVACLSLELVEVLTQRQREILEELNLPYQEKVVVSLRFLT